MTKNELIDQLIAKGFSSAEALAAVEVIKSELTSEPTHKVRSAAKVTRNFTLGATLKAASGTKRGLHRSAAFVARHTS